MRSKITAVVLTLLFLVEQLIIPKFVPAYLEWIGAVDGEWPIGAMITSVTVWFIQLIVVMFSWVKIMHEIDLNSVE